MCKFIKNWIARKLAYNGTGTTPTTTTVPDNTIIVEDGPDTTTPDPNATTPEPATTTIDPSCATPEPSKPGTSASRLVVLLDNGHASTTPGKRSPDGQLREYEVNRDLVSRISKGLTKMGIRNYIIVPEADVDVALSKRAARANEYCKEYGKDNCLFISVHVNAAGNGTEWMNARGWSVWTTKGKTRSDEYADIFWEEMCPLITKFGMNMRQDMSDGDKDYEENFTVLYKTQCPAVLTENLFMDNRTDKKFLMTEEGRSALAEGHINAILRISRKF